MSGLKFFVGGQGNFTLFRTKVDTIGCPKYCCKKWNSFRMSEQAISELGNESSADRSNGTLMAKSNFYSCTLSVHIGCRGLETPSRYYLLVKFE